MPLRKHWRELYLTAMVIIALVIIACSPFWFESLTGLVVIAGGVFIAVLGVGLYDQWHAELARVRVKTRR